MTTRAKKLRTIADLILDDKNANRGTDRGRELVGNSLERYGGGRSVLADKRGKLIAGNKTVEQAARLGKKIIVVPTRGDELVVVQRTDLDMDQDPAARELAIADNRSSEVGLDWDEAMLDELQREGLDLSFFFTDAELDEIIGGDEPGHADAQPQIELADELRRKWDTAPGQLWTIGPHRLLCGDVTSAADLATLCIGRDAERRRSKVMLLDPPYGSDYDPTKNKGKYKTKKGSVKIAGDATPGEAYGLIRRAFELTAPLLTTPAAVFVWHDARFADQLLTAAREVAWKVRAQLVWIKPSAQVSMIQQYHQQHEPAYYFTTGPKVEWNGAGTGSTVLPFGRDGDGSHPTMKPMELYAKLIANHSSPGDFILDPCAGSGTSIVAAANLNRVCLALEIDPAIVAVILERMITAFPEIEISRAPARRGKAAA